jgi:23S rRNA (pseudouridine1915-N3)-methyltransferase
MKIRILCVGRKAQDPLLSSAEGYLERLARYTPVELLRIKEGSSSKDEAKKIKEALSPQEYVVVLDEKGQMFSSVQLSQTLQRWQHQNLQKVVFVIGGAEGLHSEIKNLAKESWALSLCTLPHRLALVVLIEQLYRAHTLLRGEQYHKI